MSIEAPVSNDLVVEGDLSKQDRGTQQPAWRGDGDRHQRRHVAL